MAQYIPKAALVAEIKKRCKEAEYVFECAIYKEILSFLDILEVKEVDSFDATVCKIGNVYLKEMEKDVIAKVLEPYKNGDRVKVIIKAQKGEEV